MQVITSTEVSKTLGVSTRMLRYYEKAGLISPMRKEDYAYRCYDESTVRRLQQILVLRKLRIPLKQIAVILTDKEMQESYRCLQKRLEETNREIEALETIRTVLQTFISKIGNPERRKTCAELLDDTTLVEIAEKLVLPKSTLKEKKISMNDLDRAEEVLTDDLRVRFVMLPPATVASYHFIGENPEETVGDVVSRFVQQAKLYEIKPDARMFGFNHPNPSPDKPYGYEVWVTVPDDLNVPAPLVKKQMKGGMYAALTISFPNFQEWELIIKWVQRNEVWEADYAPEGEEIMGGLLEEHLNWVYASHRNWAEDTPDGQIDLLVPIRRK